jgi:predicted RNA binding protein YcfA (HicA-like mRNA interferase family)
MKAKRPAIAGRFAFPSFLRWHSIDSLICRYYRFVVKIRDAIRMIEQDGWYLVRARGSHRQYKYPVNPGLVTLPGKPGDDLAPGTLNSVLKQAGLKP